MTEIHTHKDCMFDAMGDSAGERHAHTVYYNICQVWPCGTPTPASRGRWCLNLESSYLNLAVPSEPNREQETDSAGGEELFSTRIWGSVTATGNICLAKAGLTSSVEKEVNRKLELNNPAASLCAVKARLAQEDCGYMPPPPPGSLRCQQICQQGKSQVRRTVWPQSFLNVCDWLFAGLF